MLLIKSQYAYFRFPFEILIKKERKSKKMENKDTIQLLKECDAGSKMAVSAIDDVLGKVKDSELLDLLIESKKHHEKLGNDLHSILNKEKTDDKEPNCMAKGMSKLKINLKMCVDNTDEMIADLITDGCNMGIKYLYKYRNQYPTASESAKNICKRLIDIEEELRKKIRKFL